MEKACLNGSIGFLTFNILFELKKRWLQMFVPKDTILQSGETTCWVKRRSLHFKAVMVEENS